MDKKTILIVLVLIVGYFLYKQYKEKNIVSANTQIIEHAPLQPNGLNGSPRGQM